MANTAPQFSGSEFKQSVVNIVWDILLLVQIYSQYNRLVESNIKIRNHPLVKSKEVNCDLHLALLNYRIVQKMSGLSGTKISLSKNLKN